MKKIALFLTVFCLFFSACAPLGGWKEPPDLTVSMAGVSHTVTSGSYHWTHFQSHTIADGIHPLDGKDILSPLETNESTATLSFPFKPNHLSAECWSDAYWERNETASQLVSLKGNTLPLRQGGFIYRISATFEQGDADYLFYVISTAEDAILTTPPALTVTTGTATATAVRGTYTWSYPAGADTMQTICSDSSGPDELLKNVLPTKTDSPTAILQFSTAPDRLEVTPGTLNGNTLTLAEGKQIYSVHATWAQGDAWYCFTVEK